MKHTKGKWTIQPAESVVEHSGVLITELEIWGKNKLLAKSVGDTTPELAANIQLMRTAPEMLSACEDALHTLSAGKQMGFKISTELTNTLKKAIEKATS